MRPNFAYTTECQRAHGKSLHCGRLISDPLNLERIRERQQPWNISGPAQLAGIEALKDTAYIQKILQYGVGAKNTFIAELKKFRFVKFSPALQILLWSS